MGMESRFTSFLSFLSPYSYNLPPPSRARENTVNIFDPNYKVPQHVAPAHPPIAPVNNFNNQFGYSLVPIYIPNEGYRYFVVVPIDKWNYLNTNLINDDRNSLEQQKYDKYDKYNGRYNAKLKKYKAYEKFTKPQLVSRSLNNSKSHYERLVQTFGHGRFKEWI